MKHFGSTITTAALAVTLGLGLVGCGGSAEQTKASTSSAQSTTTVEQTSATSTSTESQADSNETYTDRDLQQEADTTDAKRITLADGTDVTIDAEGTYVISGTASNASIVVNVDASQKVQLVLDGVTITNESAPAIYVLSADKVFVTTAAGSQNTLKVTGTFASDGENNADGVVFSKDDLVINGKGTLAIESSDHAVVSKDDLKVTGGTLQVNATGDALQANNGVYVADGTLELTAGSDGIEGDERVQIDGGTITITGAEGVESTYVQINDGELAISASDDGINATTKSQTDAATTPTIEIAGGSITIDMGQGDTDAIDANGNLIVSGGTVNITAQSAFDFDGTVEFTGGTVTVNGEQVETIENSMMGGGGMMGGHGGGMAGENGGMMGGRGGEMTPPEGMGEAPTMAG